MVIDHLKEYYKEALDNTVMAKTLIKEIREWLKKWCIQTLFQDLGCTIFVGKLERVPTGLTIVNGIRTSILHGCNVIQSEKRILLINSIYNSLQRTLRPHTSPKLPCLLSCLPSVLNSRELLYLSKQSQSVSPAILSSHLKDIIGNIIIRHNKFQHHRNQQHSWHICSLWAAAFSQWNK